MFHVLTLLSVHSLKTCIHILANFSGYMHLDFSHNHIGNGEIKTLFSTTTFPNLTTLILSHNEIKKEGIKIITRQIHTLTALDLSFNEVRDDDAITIAWELPGLRMLNLSHKDRKSTRMNSSH